jgi:hypothetical protein
MALHDLKRQIFGQVNFQSRELHSYFIAGGTKTSAWIERIKIQ